MIGFPCQPGGHTHHPRSQQHKDINNNKNVQIRMETTPDTAEKTRDLGILEQIKTKSGKVPVSLLSNLNQDDSSAVLLSAVGKVPLKTQKYDGDELSSLR